MNTSFIDFLNNVQAPFEIGPSGAVHVHGGIDLDESEVDALPEDLTVDGMLVIAGNAITALPERLVVAGSFSLMNSNISVLPTVFSVGADFLLVETRIATLPETLQVRGDLDLDGSPIEALPEDLDVSGDLCLEGTKILRLPTNMRVGGIIHPPLCLAEIPMFMATQTGPMALHVGASHHQRMQLRERLADFPDLFRITLSRSPGYQLGLRLNGLGNYMPRFEDARPA